MKRTFIILSSILTMVTAAEAQSSVWTLQDCISYAKQNNIDIRRTRVQSESAAIDVLTAKAAFWPTLSFSAGYNLTNAPWGGSGYDLTNSQWGNNKNYSGGNFGLNAGWTVFNGTRKKNITLSQTTEQQSQLSVAETENTITEQIMQLYVQILYSQEAVKVQEAQLEPSRELANFAEEKARLGSISKSDCIQITSEVSQNNYQLVSQIATVKEYLLRLKLLLNLDAEGDMEIASVDYSDDDVLAALPAASDVLAAALGYRPEIQNSKLDVESSELDIQIAKAGYYPTVSLSASTGSSFSTGYDNGFGDQVKSNWSNSIGLNVSVPIISGRQTKSAVEKARLNVETSKMALENEELTLRQTIELLWLTAASSQENYVAARDQLQAAQESCDVVEEQFKQGQKTATDLLSERTNLLSAKQQALQAKYMAIYNIDMLKFYSGAY